MKDSFNKLLRFNSTQCIKSNTIICWFVSCLVNSLLILWPPIFWPEAVCCTTLYLPTFFSTLYDMSLAIMSLLMMAPTNWFSRKNNKVTDMLVPMWRALVPTYFGTKFEKPTRNILRITFRVYGAPRRRVSAELYGNNIELFLYK